MLSDRWGSCGCAHSIGSGPEIGFGGLESSRQNQAVFRFRGAAVAGSLNSEGAYQVFGKIANCKLRHSAFIVTDEGKMKATQGGDAIYCPACCLV